ncbi:hypothetical protein ABH908_002155 [Pseudomonas frederiksbergensis]|jgi:hypothetical protein|uniref:DUF3224 domain-containing protein n=1 Tax=Pseudomonas TaxID=286 RepID=UPI00110EF861|nr:MULTISPECIES: DUF3224 domain-containing protein [unclassified Pseudomonas]QDV94637.1 DUF3224 domain-containing protein [Pseudomonas sp. ATCC 43928]CAH0155931.1 hypothetical protein SRABI130_00900 [Pseudomonas sp. Bi130]
MKMTDSCTFQITGWDEKPSQELEGTPKLSHAKVTQSYAGAIEGTSSVEYLMSYSVDGTASFVGFERICGVVAGKSGTFVVRHSGSFSEGKARSTWSVVKGAGTGDLVNLSGNGNYVAGHGEPAQVSFEYSFEPDS